MQSVRYSMRNFLQLVRMANSRPLSTPQCACRALATSSKQPADPVHVTRSEAKAPSALDSPFAVERGPSKIVLTPKQEDPEDEADMVDMVAIGPSGLEWGGPQRGGKFKEPTRYGDWEKKGICSDF